MLHRQHHAGGNQEIKLLIDDVLKLPNETSGNYYKAYIFYSQVIIIYCLYFKYVAVAYIHLAAAAMLISHYYPTLYLVKVLDMHQYSIYQSFLPCVPFFNNSFVAPSSNVRILIYFKVLIFLVNLRNPLLFERAHEN